MFPNFVEIIFLLEVFCFFFPHFLNDTLVGVLLVRVALVLKVFSRVEIPTTIPQCKVSSCNNGVFPNGPHL